MLPLNADDRMLLEVPGGFQLQLAAWVEDELGTKRCLCDLAGYNWLETYSINHNVDQRLRAAEVTVKREIFDLSLAPTVQASKLNNLNGSYVPLLHPSRRIYLQARLAPLGDPFEVPAHEGFAGPNWMQIFSGFIDRVEWGGESLRILCSDQGKTLQRFFIREEREYSTQDFGTASQLEDIVQEILDDNFGAGVVTLYSENGAAGFDPGDSPGWAVLKVGDLAPVKKQPLLELLNKLAMQRGWIVEYRFHALTNSWKLMLFAPQRASPVSQYTFQPWQYDAIPDIAVSDEGVRNLIRGYYFDAADLDEAGKPKLKSLEVGDSASQLIYGEQFMQLAEDASSEINSAAEMTELLDAALLDLGDPVAEQAVDCHPFPWAEVGDFYTFAANGTHFDTDMELAVTDVRHDFGAVPRTKLTLRGRPSGGWMRWHQRAAHPGIAPSTNTWMLDSPIANVLGNMFGGGLLSVDMGAFAEPGWLLEVHKSASPTFTPSSSTKVAEVKSDQFAVQGIAPGTTEYVKVFAKSMRGKQRSVASAAVAIASQYIQGSDVAPALKYGFSSSRSGTTSIEAGVDKEVSSLLTLESWDYGAAYNAGTGVFTVPSGGAGRYRFRGCALLSGAFPGDNGYLYLRKNGSGSAATGASRMASVDPVLGTTVLALEIDATLDLAAGDTVRLNMTTNSPRGVSSYTLQGTRSYFQAERLLTG